MEDQLVERARKHFDEFYDATEESRIREQLLDVQLKNAKQLDGISSLLHQILIAVQEIAVSARNPS